MAGKSLEYWRAQWDRADPAWNEDWEPNDKQIEANKLLFLLKRYGGYYRGLFSSFGGGLGRVVKGRWNTHHGQPVEMAVGHYSRFDYLTSPKHEAQYDVQFILADMKRCLVNQTLRPNGDLARIIRVAQEKTGALYDELTPDAINTIVRYGNDNRSAMVTFANFGNPNWVPPPRVPAWIPPTKTELRAQALMQKYGLTEIEAKAWAGRPDLVTWILQGKGWLPDPIQPEKYKNQMGHDPFAYMTSWVAGVGLTKENVERLAVAMKIEINEANLIPIKQSLIQIIETKYLNHDLLGHIDRAADLQKAIHKASTLEDLQLLIQSQLDQFKSGHQTRGNTPYTGLSDPLKHRLKGRFYQTLRSCSMILESVAAEMAQPAAAAQTN